jgi:predicted enzyme related to lactoylglutathione lyase
MTTMTQHATGMFCWSELSTTDQEGAKKFYSALFGWTPDDTPMGDGQSYTMLRKNGKEIGALYAQQKEQREQGVGPNWMPYIAVENADQAAAKVKQSGGKVLMEPFDVMEHGRMAVLQDPTTAVFSVWQPKKHTGATLVNESGSMCWNELITTDSAKAGAFYKQVFGWTDEQMPMATPMGGTYTMFKKDGAQAAGMIKATPEMKLTHPYWLIYFAVDDCDKSVAKAQQLGGKAMLPPTDIPNIGRFSVLTDPQGAYFAIIAMAKSA